MAEAFLTLMAEYEAKTQQTMQIWSDALAEAGFRGQQTPGLPFHISMGTFPLEKEEEAKALTLKLAADFAPIELHLSHIGLYQGGKVLFAAPEGSARLAALRNSCSSDSMGGHPWTPHSTILIDEQQNVIRALQVLLEHFAPLRAQLTRLRLCAFWPEREIVSAELKGKM